jgi:hypothetical protein
MLEGILVSESWGCSIRNEGGAYCRWSYSGILWKCVFDAPNLGADKLETLEFDVSGFDALAFETTSFGASRLDAFGADMSTFDTSDLVTTGSGRYEVASIVRVE